MNRGAILVIGDVMLDTYLHGKVSRISPEAPVPVVSFMNKEFRLGGAANVANNLSSLGATVKIAGIIGSDEAAKQIQTLLRDANITDNLLIVEGKATTEKMRILGNSSQLCRVDFEEIQPQCPNVREHLQNIEMSEIRMVCLSDYSKGAIPIDNRLVKFFEDQGIPTIVDPKSPNWQRYSGCSVITPNLKEFFAVVGEKMSESEIVTAAHRLCVDLDIKNIVLTMSEKGMLLVDIKGKTYRNKAVAKEVFDVTGAGDTVVAALALAISQGAQMDQAVDFASTAAQIVVSKIGTSTVSLEEIETLQNQRKKSVFNSLNELHSFVKSQKIKQNKIVMTNGCFDILHPGHVRYLQNAKDLGDLLIVAVNSDASVTRLKGPTRPINDESCRAEMLLALDCVDYVYVFDEETPLELYKLVLPDILVKGGDYQIDEIIGAEEVLSSGGLVKVLPFSQGFSTSNMIKKMTGKI